MSKRDPSETDWSFDAQNDAAYRHADLLSGGVPEPEVFDNDWETAAQWHLRMEMRFGVTELGWAMGLTYSEVQAWIDGRSSQEIRVKYAHLASRAVEEGDIVVPGTLLGRTGNTGRSTGPHLHVEVSIGPIGETPFPRGNIDPQQFFSAFSRVSLLISRYHLARGFGTNGHHGIDILTPVGTPVRADHFGVVSRSGFWRASYDTVSAAPPWNWGNMVEIIVTPLNYFGG